MAFLSPFNALLKIGGGTPFFFCFFFFFLILSAVMMTHWLLKIPKILHAGTTNLLRPSFFFFYELSFTPVLYAVFTESLKQ